MKKLLIVGGVGGAITGAALLARHRASGGGRWSRVDFAQLIERMPDDAPPKWIFRNINTIRENTERILELLESDRGSAGG